MPLLLPLLLLVHVELHLYVGESHVDQLLLELLPLGRQKADRRGVGVDLDV